MRNVTFQLPSNISTMVKILHFLCYGIASYITSYVFHIDLKSSQMFIWLVHNFQSQARIISPFVLNIIYHIPIYFVIEYFLFAPCYLCQILTQNMLLTRSNQML